MVHARARARQHLTARGVICPYGAVSAYCYREMGAPYARMSRVCVGYSHIAAPCRPGRAPMVLIRPGDYRAIMEHHAGSTPRLMVLLVWVQILNMRRYFKAPLPEPLSALRAHYRLGPKEA